MAARKKTTLSLVMFSDDQKDVALGEMIDKLGAADGVKSRTEVARMAIVKEYQRRFGGAE